MIISRRAFLGNASVAVTAAGGLEGPAPQDPSPRTASTKSDFYSQLVESNDRAVPAILKDLADVPSRSPNLRRVGANLEVLTAVFCAPESSYNRSDALIPAMQNASAVLVNAQHPDGTIDAGNLHSPPDTAFVLEAVCRAFAVLRGVNHTGLNATKGNLKKFILAAGDALVTGGVHTPNHRWVVSAALARVNSLFPAPKYVARIDDWLGEGIYIDEDGQYSERSTGIYSRVIDNALITMSRLLNRPELLEPVRRNLSMNVYYMHPDGEVETIGSRRQDQNMVADISSYYLEFRYLAIKDANPTFAAIVRFIEEKQRGRSHIGEANPLINFLEEPSLKNPLPGGGAIPTDYQKLFANSAMARIRRGDVSVSVYGGSDWPLGVASGLASNPTFFTFRKGEAVLESIRMGSEFFSEGAFHSAGLIAAGNGYTLQQRFDVPYYQPLPVDTRNSRGDYKLTPAKDYRFWSKMDFPGRPMSNIQTLNQKVSIVENAGKCELHFDISGQDGIPVTIELAFRPGGSLEGDVIEQVKDRIYFLKQGIGRYIVGGQTIEFGPGEAVHDRLNLPGSSYLAHGATLRPTGICVYIAGFTPFRRTLTVA
jgi:hypothetical protein